MASARVRDACGGAGCSRLALRGRQTCSDRRATSRAIERLHGRGAQDTVPGRRFDLLARRRGGLGIASLSLLLARCDILSMNDCVMPGCDRGHSAFVPLISRRGGPAWRSRCCRATDGHTGGNSPHLLHTGTALALVPSNDLILAPKHRSAPRWRRACQEPYVNAEASAAIHLGWRVEPLQGLPISLYCEHLSAMAGRTEA